MGFGPGWDALDAVFQARYPGATPHVIRSLVDPVVSPDPCKQVAAWPDGPWWHVVGYGLTELFAKQSPMADQDGWGYELTMRVRRDASDAPAWATSLIARMIRYAETTGARLAEGEWFAYTDGGPLIAGTDVAAALFLRDTALPERHRTPFGDVLFRQVVGITAEELALIKHEGPARLVAALRAWSPVLETAPGRAALLTRPVEVAPMAPAPAAPLRPWRSLEARILRLSRSFTGEREVELGTDDARLVGAHLAQILAKEGELRVASDLAVVAFVRGGDCRVEVVEEEFDREILRITLPLELASGVAEALRAEPSAGASAVPGLAGVRFRRVDR